MQLKVAADASKVNPIRLLAVPVTVRWQLLNLKDIEVQKPVRANSNEESA